MNVPGRIHPVDSHFLEDYGHTVGVQTGRGGQGMSADDATQEEGQPKLWVPLLKNICRSHPEGAVLCFLSGWNEIRTLLRALETDPFFDPVRKGEEGGGSEELWTKGLNRDRERKGRTRKGVNRRRWRKKKGSMGLLKRHR